ncbi:hypothetical protein BLNAU_21242 [Blattamonas nauphoetae]|uniref:Uncharacterized protein n=1 Tax=Blattamonas nauphoetae TaxID=2049346 RepID=A0ABQ9WWG5_9EUKA|nr:hypothetical protein BLNAU_21242 [Blattamonas nauphoetae]
MEPLRSFDNKASCHHQQLSESRCHQEGRDTVQLNWIFNGIDNRIGSIAMTRDSATNVIQMEYGTLTRSNDHCALYEQRAVFHSREIWRPNDFEERRTHNRVDQHDCRYWRRGTLEVARSMVVKGKQSIPGTTFFYPEDIATLSSSHSHEGSSFALSVTSPQALFTTVPSFRQTGTFSVESEYRV